MPNGHPRAPVILAACVAAFAIPGCATGIRERALRRPGHLRLGCGAIDSLALTSDTARTSGRVVLRVTDARRDSSAGPLYGTASWPVRLRFAPSQDLRATVQHDAARVLAAKGIAVLDSAESPDDSATASRGSLAILEASTDWFSPLTRQGFVTATVRLGAELRSCTGARLWTATLVSVDTATARYITVHTHQAALSGAYCRAIEQLSDSVATYTVETPGSGRRGPR